MPGSAVTGVTWDNRGIGFTIVRAHWGHLLGNAMACAGCSQAAVAKLGMEALPASVSTGCRQDIWIYVQGPWDCLKEKL